MKKRFTIKPFQLFALIVLVFVGFSCSESTFDEQDGERITPDQHYKSLDDVGTSLIGAISPLQNVIPKLIMIDGLRSDQMMITPTADAFVKDINNQVLTLDNPYLDASDYYKVIINCNEGLANFHKVSETDRDFNQFYLKYTKAALISLKSWTYLNLIRLYGQAAWITDNMASIPENFDQNILLKDVLIDTLINRLIPTIPTEAELSQMPELNVSYYMNGKAVLGELYLEKGDYANAVKYLKMAAESYGNNADLYKVSSYAKEGWKSIFMNAESGIYENISVIPYDHQEGQFNPLAKWLLPNDQFMVKPTESLIDSFLTQKPAAGTGGDVNRGIGATIDTTASGEFYINKYSINKNEPFSSDIVISRAADIHLLLAEAMNRNGDSKNALILLNDGFKGTPPVPAAYNRWNKNIGIRGRAYLKPKIVPAVVVEIVGNDTIERVLEGEERVEYIEDLIMDERALELAFEGKRWFDLVRVANRRQDPSYLANKVVAKFTDPAEQEAVRQKLMNTANWYLPSQK
ncbi:MAG TPA: RagB/SusD family nutrient uptake outer membrane protein [Prolixibacteraceae bacterium]|nr:RagB/SusD family nutrient uptake outer membrane protein [Prolixibacteraceae bacterium]